MSRSVGAGKLTTCVVKRLAVGTTKVAAVLTRGARVLASTEARVARRQAHLTLREKAARGRAHIDTLTVIVMHGRSATLRRIRVRI